MASSFDPPPPDARYTLSDLLRQDFHVEQVDAHILHVADHGAWLVAATVHPVLYSVFEGSFIVCADGEAAFELRQGEHALMLLGDPHRIGTSASPIAFPALPPGSGERIDEVRLGGSATRCVVLRSVLELRFLSKYSSTHRVFPKIVPMFLPGSGRVIDDRPALESLGFDPAPLLTGIMVPGGSALAIAFVNLQLCSAVQQWGRYLWDDLTPDGRNPNTRRIASIIGQMRSGLDHDWTVSELARRCGLSRSAFAAAFAGVIGTAPMEYLTAERMKKASRLLSNRSLSMLEVGQRVGYPIESSFARAFRRYWGVAPRDFVHRQD